MKLPASFNPYMAYAKKNRGVILAIVLGLAVIIYIYYKGKKAGRVYIPDVDYIKDQKMILANFNPNILADELHRVMCGLFTLAGTKDAAWLKLLNVGTDNMIIAVYNTFNQRYGSEGKGSLTKWIDDETYYDLLTGVKGKLLTKLRSLNCK